MAFVFLAIILLFACLAFFYLFTNNFARETLDVLFPAIGAILFSLYLGVKSVWVDRPPARRFGTTVAVLHDWQHGTIRGMAPVTRHQLPRFGEFEGAQLLDRMPQYNAFKTIPIVERLRDIEGVPDSPAEKMIANFVEFAVLTWLANAERSPGYSPVRSIQLISGEGAGGGVPVSLKSVEVRSSGRERNPLVEANPISLLLPGGSSAERSSNNSNMTVTITIQTKHSRVVFQLQKRVFELMDGPSGRDAERIYAALGLPTTPVGLGIRAFELEVTAEQSAFFRFSRQAKIELAWFATLERELDADFSWARLRALYTSE